MKPDPARQPLGLVLAALILGIFHPSQAGDVPSKAVESYRDGDPEKALKFGSSQSQDPLERLAFHQAQIHSKESPDLESGLDGLRSLYQDLALDSRLRMEAGISLARVIQLERRRGRPRDADPEVPEQLFEQVRGLDPGSQSACYAALYQAEDSFLSEDRSEQEKALSLLEAFLKNFEGDASHTVFLHLVLDTLYIDLRRDYESAVKHLRKAYDLGIANDVSARDALFRIGRILHVELGRKAEARKTYEEYLEKYPFSRDTPLVNRYLSQLGRVR